MALAFSSPGLVAVAPFHLFLSSASPQNCGIPEPRFTLSVLVFSFQLHPHERRGARSLEFKPFIKPMGVHITTIVYLRIVIQIGSLHVLALLLMGVEPQGGCVGLARYLSVFVFPPTQPAELQWSQFSPGIPRCSTWAWR